MARFYLFLSTTVLLTSCGLFSRSQPATSITQTERFDPATRSWTPLTQTPEPLQASVPQEFAPEESFADAQVLSSGNSVPGETVDSSTSENPGLMNRVGRAATSPLRWVGLGKEEDAQP